MSRQHVHEAIKSGVGVGVGFEGSSKEAQISNMNQGCRDTEQCIYFHIYFGEGGMSVEIREHLVGTPQSGCWALRLSHQVLLQVLYPPRHLAGPCFFFYV